MKKKLLWGALGVLLLIQFIRPGMKNPPVDAAADFQNTAQPPADVLVSLKTACYDCHSNETRWPWYSQIAPVSWWTANHVAEGREHLNFSTFGQLAPGDRAEVLGEAAENIREGEMPLWSYTLLHSEAKLSDAERQALLAWLDANGGEGGGENESAAGTNQPAGQGQNHKNEQKEDD